MRKFLIRFVAPLFLVASLVGCTTAHTEIRNQGGVQMVCSWTETAGILDEASLRCYPVDGGVYP